MTKPPALHRENMESTLRTTARIAACVVATCTGWGAAAQTIPPVTQMETDLCRSGPRVVPCGGKHSTRVVKSTQRALFLRLASGRTLRYEQDASDTDARQEHSYEGYIRRINAHVIRMAGWETANVWLVDDATGESFSVGPESFAVSADGRWVASHACDWYSNSCLISMEAYPSSPAQPGPWHCELSAEKLEPLVWSGARSLRVKAESDQSASEPTLKPDKTYRVWTGASGQWRTNLPCKAE